MISINIVTAFALTLLAHIVGRLFSNRFPAIAVVLSSMAFAMLLLWLLRWDYAQYLAFSNPVFSHLLGYITVALAVPIAFINWKEYPIALLLKILLAASVLGVALPMGLAYLLGMAKPLVLAFAGRAVTTPIALGIAIALDTHALVVVMIAIISGLVGGAMAPMLCKHIQDDRAAGLAIGLMAHIAGTAQAYQISSTAGNFAALGMALNGLITAAWVPLVLPLVL